MGGMVRKGFQTIQEARGRTLDVSNVGALVATKSVNNHEKSIFWSSIRETFDTLWTVPLMVYKSF